jgi:hypothetical protein
VLRLTGILVVVAVLNVTCLVCALACCCDLIVAPRTSNHSPCQGMIHSPHVNLDWLGFDPDLPVTVAVAAFMESPQEPQVTVFDLSIPSPPPKA